MRNFITFAQSIRKQKCQKVGGNLLNITKRFAYSCVRKRRKFSEDARKPSGSLVSAWAAISYIFIFGFPTTF